MVSEFQKNIADETMNETGIEYLDFTWNPYTGCKHFQTGICGGGGQEFCCWAKGLAEGRLKRFYPLGFAPTWHPERLEEPTRVKKPSRIGVCFMGDLFGDWNNAQRYAYRTLETMNTVRGEILNIVRQCPQHTFLFLTKAPWNLAQFNPWPGNALVGVSITGAEPVIRQREMMEQLRKVRGARLWLSYEPMLGPLQVSLLGISRLVMGAQSGRGGVKPKLEWVKEAEFEAVRCWYVPVWRKKNLCSALGLAERREREHEKQ